MYFDEGLKLWVVSAPYLVDQALKEARLRVRPPGEAVPKALQGRPVGEVFSLLVRMNDGEFHQRHRPDVEAAAKRFSEEAVAQAAAAATHDLTARTDPNALLSAIPVQAMARLLGVANEDLDRTVTWVHDFTQGIAASATPEAIARADAATIALMAQGEREGLSRPRAANRIAFMQQSLDATAGLIGNAIAAALKDPSADPAAIARQDPAIHNTRRFAPAEVELGGQLVEPGQGLVLVLVPDCPFGRGAHACPGERIALQIATTAVRTLQAIAPLHQTFGAVKGYRPLPNARIPVFQP